MSKPGSLEQTGNPARLENTGAVAAKSLFILLGGIAAGIVGGTVLPRSSKERELLAPVGARIGLAAKNAFEAGKDAGGETLANAGLSADNLRQQVSKLVEQLFKAAGNAADAAAVAARSGAGHKG